MTDGERPCVECGGHHFGLRHGQWLWTLEHIKDDALATARKLLAECEGDARQMSLRTIEYDEEIERLEASLAAAREQLARLYDVNDERNRIGEELVLARAALAAAREENGRLREALEGLREAHGHEMDEHGNPWHPSWCVACVARAALAREDGDGR